MLNVSECFLASFIRINIDLLICYKESGDISICLLPIIHSSPLIFIFIHLFVCLQVYYVKVFLSVWLSDGTYSLLYQVVFSRYTCKYFPLHYIYAVHWDGGHDYYVWCLKFLLSVQSVDVRFPALMCFFVWLVLKPFLTCIWCFAQSLVGNIKSFDFLHKFLILCRTLRAPMKLSLHIMKPRDLIFACLIVMIVLIQLNQICRNCLWVVFGKVCECVRMDFFFFFFFYVLCLSCIISFFLCLSSFLPGYGGCCHLHGMPLMHLVSIPAYCSLFLVASLHCQCYDWIVGFFTVDKVDHPFARYELSKDFVLNKLWICCNCPQCRSVMGHANANFDESFANVTNYGVVFLLVLRPVDENE